MIRWFRAPRQYFNIPSAPAFAFATLLVIASILLLQVSAPDAANHTAAALLAVVGLLLQAAVFLRYARKALHYRAAPEDITPSRAAFARRAVQLQVAAEVARDASGSLDMDDVLNRAVELVRSRFGFYHAGIFLLDAEGEYAILQAASGPASQQMLEPAHRLKVGETSIVGYVVHTGKPRIALNVGADSVHFKNPVLPETRSEMALPLKLGSTVIGALDVQSQHEAAFEEDDISILQTLADQLAVTIDHARLHAKVQEYAALLEQRVTERTAELAHERAQLQVILESMVEGVMYVEHHEAQYINRAFSELTGFSPAEWKARAAAIRAGNDPGDQIAQTYNMIATAVDEQGFWHGELELEHTDGTRYDAAITAVRVSRADGKAIGGVAILRDISKEKALQDQKARFVANASHELRTPITNLKTRLYLLHNQPERFGEHMAVIDHVVERMRDLVEHLLDLSRFERGTIKLEKTHVNLQELVTQALAVQHAEADAKQVELHSTMPAEPLVVLGDPQRLNQVLTNLVTNAINYTPSGGRVVVSLEPKVEDGGSFVWIHVEDTGVGIPPEAMDLIFQPFFRVGENPAQGTGLGLSICKEIVDLHGGEIEVRSRQGRGSRFSVKLTLVAPATSSTAI